MSVTKKARRSDSLYFDNSKMPRRTLCDMVAQLEEDKRELHDLVRYIMHQCNDGNPRCDECIGWNDGECVALLRMRELGVEVDE